MADARRVTLDLEQSLEEILEMLSHKFNKTRAQVLRESLVFLSCCVARTKTSTETKGEGNEATVANPTL